MLDPKEIDTYFDSQSANRSGTETELSSYSRKVMLAKLILPAVAAVLAVTVLVFPSLKKDLKEFGLDFAITKGDIEKLNVEKTLVYVTDSNNRVNTFSAKQINETKAGSQKYKLKTPEALIPLSRNETLKLKSPDGFYNQQTKILTLPNNVEADFSGGMTLHTTKVSFDFDKSFGSTKEPVTGSGTLGIVKAQGLEFSGKDNTFTFTGKTHIILREKNMGKK